MGRDIKAIVCEGKRDELVKNNDKEITIRKHATRGREKKGSILCNNVTEDNNAKRG